MYWIILLAYTLDPSYGGGKFNILLFTLAHGFSNKMNLDGIAQAWSLTVEMSYYVLAPLLSLAIMRNVQTVLLSSFLIFIFLFGVGWVWQLANGNPRSFFTPLQFLTNGTLAGQSLFFLAGTALATHRSTFRPFKLPFSKTWIGTIGVIISVACSSLFHQSIYDQANNHLAGFIFQLFAIGFFGLIWLQGISEESNLQTKLFGSSFMVLLGNASFIFYLIHISYINLKIKEYIYLADHNYVILWILSCLLYVLIEKPLYKACKNVIQRI